MLRTQNSEEEILLYIGDTAINASITSICNSYEEAKQVIKNLTI